MEFKLFLTYFMFFETGKKFIKSFSDIRNEKCTVFVIQKVAAANVLLRKHFTDLDYLDWFSRYQRFCEPPHL